MAEKQPVESEGGHAHHFLAASHVASERKTWAVIWLCSAMMLAEIIGGLTFGSIALVADGLHMSTHAGALLLAALAYTYSRKHSGDARFSFGTGKLGDLAGFSSAIVLAMISILIGYESIARILSPVPIRFGEALPLALVGLAVNIASAWLLSGSDHHHHGDEHGHAADVHRVETKAGPIEISIFEDGVPPRFQIRSDSFKPSAGSIELATLRPDGACQTFTMVERGEYLETTEEIPEPHEFAVTLRIADESPQTIRFEEHEHAHSSAHRDNNMRAAVVHVLADAAVSVLVIVGLILARTFGWLWMDPVAGLVGALVIASWSYGLIRDTGAILIDMNADQKLTARMRQLIECDGDKVADLHLWRLGPGHLGAIVSVLTKHSRPTSYYRERLKSFRAVSHLTLEVSALTNGPSTPSRAGEL